MNIRKLSTTIGGHIVLASITTIGIMSFSGIQAWQYWLLVGTGLLLYLQPALPFVFFKLNPKTVSSSLTLALAFYSSALFSQAL